MAMHTNETLFHNRSSAEQNIDMLTRRLEATKYITALTVQSILNIERTKYF